MNFGYRNIGFFVLLIMLAGLIGCSSVKQSTGTKGKKGSANLTDKEKTKAERIFIDAMKAKMLGDYQDAISLFAESVRKDPTNHAALFELAKYHYETGQLDAALAFSKGAAELQPENKWYLRLYAEILGDKNHFKEASKIYESLVEKNPNEYEFYLDWAYTMVKSEQYDDAIKIYETLEGFIGVNENVIFQKQRIFLKMGKVDKAAEEIKKLIELNPFESKYYIMLAELYEVNNMPEKSAEIYKELLVIAPQDPNAYLALASFHRNQGNREKYMHYLKIAFRSDDLGIDPKIKILFPYINFINKDSVKKEEAFILSEVLIETHPDEAKAHAMYGDFLNYDNQLSAARDHYKMALKLDNSRYTVWQQVLEIEWQLEQFDSLASTSEKAMDLFPNQPVIYFYSGMAKLQLKQYEAAIKDMDAAIIMNPDNKFLVSQLYANLGDAYHGLKLDDASDSCYDASLEYDPKNEYVLNNYSYYLSLREKNLNKALEMSTLANEIKPGIASFQDTRGWILYKLQKYEESKEWLFKAMKNDGEENAVILEHYGDVLYQLGDVENAIEYWKKARENGSDSEMIDKKIADKKLYE